jgi:hypothetical protein
MVGVDGGVRHGTALYPHTYADILLDDRRTRSSRLNTPDTTSAKTSTPSP